MPATPGTWRLRWPVYRKMPPAPTIFADTPVLELPQAPAQCCHAHRVSSRYLALNTQQYAIGPYQGHIIQGERYDFPDDIARMLVEAGYLRPLNPWEQLLEETDGDPH